MENLVITTLNGQLKGKICSNIDDEKFYAFLGIPYAKPPLGKLRFKAPLPVESWEGVRDATQEGEQCIQKNGSDYIGSENCLFLNIFTKSLPDKNGKLKPVMVFIHGGIFMTGSSSTKTYGPNILLTEDIVLVTINYRVGVLGFLSLKDTSLEVPGNAGLKDQILALKWIQKNIAFFNGDPDNVTIFGQSAGAVSAHYHILSPSTNGLFHKVILQSGTSFCPWASSDPNVNDFVKYLNVLSTDEKELLEGLRNVTAEQLLKAQQQFCEEKGTLLRIFGPVIEKPNKTAVIIEDPLNIISSGQYNKVPMILGYTSNEGLIEKYMEMSSAAREEPVKDKSFQEYIPWQLDLNKGSDNWNFVINKMEKVYKSKENIDNPYLVGTDSFFVASVMAAVHNHLKVQKEPIYLYRMSVITLRRFLSQHIKDLDPKLGVCHEDDLGYLFSSEVLPNPIPKGSIEDLTVRRFVKLWTNFAKYGNPTPNQIEFGTLWKAVETNHRYFLDIGHKLTLETDPEYERMELWKEIFRTNPQTINFLN